MLGSTLHTQSHLPEFTWKVEMQMSIQSIHTAMQSYSISRFFHEDIDMSSAPWMENTQRAGSA
jgi:hypothetical protein